MTNNTKINFCTACFIAFLLIFGEACTCNTQLLRVNDKNEMMGSTNSPVSIELELSKKQKQALSEGRLVLSEVLNNNKDLNSQIPVQLERVNENGKHILTFILQSGKQGLRYFKLSESKLSKGDLLEVKLVFNNKQYLIKENSCNILQYNYQTVNEDDVIRPRRKKDTKIVYHIIDGGVYYEEYLRANPLVERKSTTSKIYAIPRSDYIHPLYGLKGELLTCDWPDGEHPHHRGIFWAWPEVEYKSEYGDIYALQRVFARPTGNIETVSGNVFAEIQAENLWMWEDNVPIVRENVTIRAYRSERKSRIIDLAISLQAIEDSVSIATRFTNSYGGLNVRMQTPKEQEIYHFTDLLELDTIRGWAGFNGVFEGNNKKSGLIILQNKNNPEYPGEWIDYPNLSWVQPTFPTPGSRFFLSKSEPLTLKYRLIVHTGGIPNKSTLLKKWNAYNIPIAEDF